MFCSSRLIVLVITCCILPALSRGEDVYARANLLQNLKAASQASLNKTNSSLSSCNSISCYRYYNSQTAPYFIQHWPDVHLSTGEFYSGSIPINESDPDRTLFFVFKPAEEQPVNEVVIWLNGGPGCSSLEGFFQENGPLLRQAGTVGWRKNYYAWSKMTNMLWVEQPIGTGFTRGKITATNEIDVAKEFIGFFKNWEKLFGIENYKIYVTGESYAGRYVPYISAEMLDQNDSTYFNLSGALIYDPCIGDCGGYVQSTVPVPSFLEARNYMFNFNQSFLDTLDSWSRNCGLKEYMDTYLQFPPPKRQPLETHSFANQCKEDNSIFLRLYQAWTAINPCANSYYIADFCPVRSDENGHELHLYLDRTDVRKAIHAPLDGVPWYECNEREPFADKGVDHSPPPIEGALPQVIEATNRVLVANADWDFVIVTNGTLLSIQNMTWNGLLGFQRPPTADSLFRCMTLPTERLRSGGLLAHDPQGIMGKKHYERGLMWVETYLSGHMQPQYQPRATWRHLEWLLGRIDDL